MQLPQPVDAMTGFPGPATQANQTQPLQPIRKAQVSRVDSSQPPHSFSEKHIPPTTTLGLPNAAKDTLTEPPADILRELGTSSPRQLAPQTLLASSLGF